MDRKQDLQALFDALQHHSEQARSLQNSIKRVLATKKEAELKRQDEMLQQQLDTMTQDINQLQKKISTLKEQANENQETKQDSSSDENRERKTSTQNKRLPDPYDQENTYQLKAIMMPQIYTQSKGLQAELALFNRRNELRSQRKERQVSYNRETNLSVATTLHILNMHDKRAKQAEKRAEELQAELDSRDGKEGEGKNYQSSSAAGDRPQSHLSPVKVDDLVKRNQLLTEESQGHQREIQRLKKENADLMLKVKHASSDRDLMMSQLGTSETARKELFTRFQKQKAQHDRLARSLTRQSTDWIEARKQRNQEEEDYRWKQVGHAAPHGAQARTFSLPVPRNVDQPKKMYPVTAYAQTSAA